MVFKKMLDSTQPGEKQNMKNVSTQQCWPETSCFEPVVSVHISVCLVETRRCRFAVTMPVLDRPSERAVQIRQAARKAFVDSQDDKAMRRALVTRPRPWRDFTVGDQVAFWRKEKGRGMRSGHARWHGRGIVLALCPGSKNVDRLQAPIAQGVARTVADGNSH